MGRNSKHGDSGLNFGSLNAIPRLNVIYPDIIGEIERIETMARGASVRDRHRLLEQYGEHRRGQWRKMKGFAHVRLPDGTIVRAEVHWYEASGIGKREVKVKRLLYEVR